MDGTRDASIRTGSVWPSKHPVNMLEHAIRILQLDSKRTMFYSALLLQQHYRPLGGPASTYYEFGVGEGASLVSYSRALDSASRVTRIKDSEVRIIGFDSFEGLPESNDIRDRHPQWQAGMFRRSEESIRRRVLRSLPKRFHKGLQLVNGRFEETLSSTLRDKLQAFPPAIINIDCDYYTACKVILDWVSPLLRTGSILYFDDVWDFWGHPNFGEPAAIREFTNSSRGQLIPFTRIPVPGQGRAYVYVDDQFHPNP